MFDGDTPLRLVLLLPLRESWGEGVSGRLVCHLTLTLSRKEKELMLTSRCIKWLESWQEGQMLV